MMNPLFMLISLVCSLVFWVIVISVTLSWLVAFQVVNLRNPLMARLYRAVEAITDRIYAPVRRVMPTNFGGVDISPVVILILLQVVQYTLRWLSVRYGL